MSKTDNKNDQNNNSESNTKNDSLVQNSNDALSAIGNISEAKGSIKINNTKIDLGKAGKILSHQTNLVSWGLSGKHIAEGVKEGKAVEAIVSEGGAYAGSKICGKIAQSAIKKVPMPLPCKAAVVIASEFVGGNAAEKAIGKAKECYNYCCAKKESINSSEINNTSKQKVLDDAESNNEKNNIPSVELPFDKKNDSFFDKKRYEPFDFCSKKSPLGNNNPSQLFGNKHKFSSPIEDNIYGNVYPHQLNSDFSLGKSNTNFLSSNNNLSHNKFLGSNTFPTSLGKSNTNFLGSNTFPTSLGKSNTNNLSSNNFSSSLGSSSANNLSSNNFSSSLGSSFANNLSSNNFSSSLGRSNTNFLSSNNFSSSNFMSFNNHL